jgi:hypothetical protein
LSTLSISTFFCVPVEGLAMLSCAARRRRRARQRAAASTPRPAVAPWPVSAHAARRATPRPRPHLHACELARNTAPPRRVAASSLVARERGRSRAAAQNPTCLCPSKPASRVAPAPRQPGDDSAFPRRAAPALAHGEHSRAAASCQRRRRVRPPARRGALAAPRARSSCRAVHVQSACFARTAAAMWKLQAAAGQGDPDLVTLNGASTARTSRGAAHPRARCAPKRAQAPHSGSVPRARVLAPRPAQRCTRACACLTRRRAATCARALRRARRLPGPPDVGV